MKFQPLIFAAFKKSGKKVFSAFLCFCKETLAKKQTTFLLYKRKVDKERNVKKYVFNTAYPLSRSRLVLV